MWALEGFHVAVNRVEPDAVAAAAGRSLDDVEASAARIVIHGANGVADDGLDEMFLTAWFDLAWKRRLPTSFSTPRDRRIWQQWSMAVVGIVLHGIWNWNRC